MTEQNELKPNEVKRRLNLQKWNEIINRRQASGQTIKQYCRENNINESAYYYWQQLLRKKACENINLVPETCTFIEIAPRSHPIQKNEAIASTENVMIGETTTIHLRLGDVDIYVNELSSPQKLTAILRSVRSSLC